MFDRKIMAERLQAIRLRKSAELGRKLTQADVAAAADVSRSHVANAEGGKTGISVEAAFNLAQFYGVSLDYLTGLSVSELESARDTVKDADERSLLRMWRAMNDGERAAMASVAERLAEKASDASAA
ncbi:helix-turn-helix domain-containing protein [Asaia lannensis]|uniref:Helix-turn-helix domain-containing protein n=1 Tax=Asaia lannensis NBRC 102526 TaxID=1307926 RepID=A0ABT1CIH0_9PROT|nr:helix-turn-helix domain-containing protein [Asaia lannensis]MCO6160652.1 helix-turn-helix domain-containing protein [Asaia lannensis NBRC 102526]GBR02086.1 putative transcriptional regulator [Asaia lannensis NBRC 102526]